MAWLSPFALYCQGLLNDGRSLLLHETAQDNRDIDTTSEVDFLKVEMHSIIRRDKMHKAATMELWFKVKNVNVNLEELNQLSGFIRVECLVEF